MGKKLLIVGGALLASSSSTPLTHTMPGLAFPSLIGALVLATHLCRKEIEQLPADSSVRADWRDHLASHPLAIGWAKR